MNFTIWPTSDFKDTEVEPVQLARSTVFILCLYVLSVLFVGIVGRALIWCSFD